jgi:hypothetical protein
MVLMVVLSLGGALVVTFSAQTALQSDSDFLSSIPSIAGREGHAYKAPTRRIHTTTASFISTP